MKREELLPYGLKTDLISFRLVCPCCGRSGGIGATGRNIGSGEIVSEDEARQVAVEKWNEL